MSESEIIHSAAQLQAGDHISWPTRKSCVHVSHHAIVVAQKGGDRIKIIHVRIDFLQAIGDSGCSGNSKTYAVREDVKDFSKQMEKGTLRRYVYEARDCQEPVDVIQNARTQLGEYNFHPLDNNCEHFARWCKTGHRESYLVKSMRSVPGLEATARIYVCF